ncbi:transposable element Tcb2 transposase [Trichonephila clavipes]|nr:transposable element Tcb2 transposase [Trichonephila clavipes]
MIVCNTHPNRKRRENVRPHRANLVDKFLKSEDIHRKDWPVRSPDFIRKEHAWNALGRTIVTRNTPPKTIQDLKTDLLIEWE